MEKAFVSVHILDIAFPADHEYSYALPQEMRPFVKEGTLLEVPFGISNKHVSAVAVGFSDEAAFPRIKNVFRVLDYPFDIPKELIGLCRFMKERFFCTFGQAFRAVLPPGINLGSETYYVPTGKQAKEELNEAAELLYRSVCVSGEVTKTKLTDDFGEQTEKVLSHLLDAGLIEKKTRVERKISEKTVTTLQLVGSPEEITELLENPGLSEKQKAAVELLTHYPCATQAELAEIGGITPAVLSALVRKGIVSKEIVRVRRDTPAKEIPYSPSTSPLSEEQEAAVGKLGELSDTETPQAALLYGVTGSGKTRVIIEVVRHVLEKGKTAIVLLPEIGLTAQAMNVYRKEFGPQLSVIHSMLSVGERLDAFRAMREGKCKVVLGTRSAVFSPLDGLGLIVIDEEQEATYKSEMSPKYHARDIARFRVAKTGGLLLLASATPSVESYYKALTGVYTLIRLTKRYGEAVLPDVQIEDLRNDGGIFPDKLIGTRLEQELQDTLGRNKQAILFVNRRGYHSHVSCRKCGTVMECPNCSVSLTYHAYDGERKTDGRLSCHYCGYAAKMPRVCPVCGSEHIGFFGFGTQKLQDELEERLAGAKAIRMDADTTTEKSSHDRILESFGNGDADILYGTQMVSKGLDFPNVDLVGVISVDSSLYQNDFRAGERTFSLITQLVGRAGRSGSKGLAVLQTYNPDNEILRLAATQDYEKFYESEIVLRRAVAFPPFCSAAVFTFSSVEEKDCTVFAKGFEAMLAQTREEAYTDVTLQCFGPYPGGVYKVGGRYRQRIILKYSDSARARKFLADVYEQGLTKCPRQVRLDIDANPAVI